MGTGAMTTQWDTFSQGAFDSFSESTLLERGQSVCRIETRDWPAGVYLAIDRSSREIMYAESGALDSSISQWVSYCDETGGCTNSAAKPSTPTLDDTGEIRVWRRSRFICRWAEETLTSTKPYSYFYNANELNNWGLIWRHGIGFGSWAGFSPDSLTMIVGCSHGSLRNTTPT